MLQVFETAPPEPHVLLTRHNTHPVIVDKAGLVAEMRLVKHLFERGIMAQRGIEY